MYDYIKGKLVSKTSSSKGSFITVETGGIGYLFEVCARDYNELNEEDTKIFTVLIHREDKMFLCGFKRKETRDIFNILTTVSGVGTKMALTLVDCFDTAEIVTLVVENNYKALTKAKGIGPKLAQKIVLELKDKLINFDSPQIPRLTQAVSAEVEHAFNDTAAVLTSLGYTETEIRSAFSKLNTEISPDTPTEIILKKALQTLSV